MHIVKGAEEIFAGFEKCLINAGVKNIVTEGGQNAGEFLERAQRARYLKEKEISAEEKVTC